MIEHWCIQITTPTTQYMCCSSTQYTGLWELARPLLDGVMLPPCGALFSSGPPTAWLSSWDGICHFNSAVTKRSVFTQKAFKYQCMHLHQLIHQIYLGGVKLNISHLRGSFNSWGMTSPGTIKSMWWRVHLDIYYTGEGGYFSCIILFVIIRKIKVAYSTNSPNFGLVFCLVLNLISCIYIHSYWLTDAKPVPAMILEYYCRLSYRCVFCCFPVIDRYLCSPPKTATASKFT